MQETWDRSLVWEDPTCCGATEPVHHNCGACALETRNCNYWAHMSQLLKPMVFPVTMYGCESRTIKEAEHRRINAFKLWCWRRLLKVPWTARRSNQPILKEINPEYSLEGQAEAEAPIFWPPDVKSWLTGKDLDAGQDWRQEEKGTTEDEMVGWHHQLDGNEFEQIPGDSEGQGSLACCSSWGHKESDKTERLNNSNVP